MWLTFFFCLCRTRSLLILSAWLWSGLASGCGGHLLVASVFFFFLCGLRAQGITADANILINEARLSAQRYLYAYQQPIPVEFLVQQICDTKQGYTQFGGLRPFGISFLFAGWDRHYKYQLYQSDPSGNYGGWKATAIGANSAAAQSILKSDYKEDLSLNDALLLAIKVLSKTMDATTLSPDKLELCTLSRPDGAETPVYHTLDDSELEVLLKQSNLLAPQKGDGQ